MLLIVEVVFEIVLGLSDLNADRSASPYTGDSHLVHSEGSSLVRTDVSGTSHDLTRS
jgi:hypothetical protein